MKYINLSLLVLVLFLCSCQNEDPLINDENVLGSATTELREISGLVYEEFSFYNHELKSQPLSNVSIRLMHNGVTLDEVNSSNRGRFTFAEQQVPEDEAYLIFEAPGFHKNVVRVIDQFVADPGMDVVPNDYYFTLIRETFDGVNGSAITDEGPYIKLIMQPEGETLPLYYITNANNELIGARKNISSSTIFEITTLANEPLFFNYITPCGTETIEMGPFSEDTDITNLVQEFSYIIGEWETVRVAAYDCDGTALPLDEWDKFYNADGITKWDGSSTNISYFADSDCFLEQNPNILVSVAIQNPRLYGETSMIYSSELSGVLAVTLCEEDDTYLNYSVGTGPDVVPNLYTYANILPNGSLLLKQKDPVSVNKTDIAFYISESNEGSSTQGDVTFTDRPHNDFVNVSHVGDNLNVTITHNDGNFIEGTFDGPVYDGFESSLGNLTGSFRARIQ